MINEQQTQMLTMLAQGLSVPPRTPILRTPEEYGMEYAPLHKWQRAPTLSVSNQYQPTVENILIMIPAILTLTIIPIRATREIEAKYQANNQVISNKHTYHEYNGLGSFLFADHNQRDDTKAVKNLMRKTLNTAFRSGKLR